MKRYKQGNKEGAFLNIFHMLDKFLTYGENNFTENIETICHC